MEAEHKIIGKAFDFATRNHEGQTRRFTGEPYIVHPIRVAEIVLHLIGEKENIICACFLHDCVEDTDATLEEIAREFNQEIADLVKELTSDKDEIAKKGKDQYLLEKMLAMTDDALLIKLADRCDNTSDLNVPADDPERIRFVGRYKYETEFIIRNLVENRKLTPNHLVLVERIKENIK